MNGRRPTKTYGKKIKKKHYLFVLANALAPPTATVFTRTEKEKKNPPTHNRCININVSLIELLYVLHQNETSS